MREFGELIRKARQKKGISLRSLGDLLGYSAPYLSDVENGRRNPFPEDRWKGVADLLGLDMSEMRMAASMSTGKFILPAATKTHNRVAAKLVSSWLTLSVNQLREIEKILES